MAAAYPNASGLVSSMSRRVAMCIEKNRDMIKEGYNPLHKELFDENSGQIEIVKRKAVKIKDDVFTSPILDASTCNKILEEFDRYIPYSTDQYFY